MSETETAKQNIIIIDDDKFLLDMYTVKFGERGFVVTQCSSAEEALEKIKGGFHPDIFLVDIIMQKMDGFAFIQAINDQDLKGQSAVIILSNLGQKEDVEHGLKLGADGYIIKASATPSEVVTKVLDIVNSKKKK
jgi:DNA-binding response OmpR family regulator